MSKTTETVTITDFLLARIARDEAMTEEYIMEFGGVWSPERILAECEAKRRIVMFCNPDDGYEGHILKLMAAVYADHPDCRDEWKL